MGRMLLWIEDLAAALLLVAWITAIGARRQRRGVQLALPTVAASVIFLVAMLAVIGAYFLHYEKLCAPNLVPYTASWAILFAAGALAVLARGLRKRDDDSRRRRGGVWGDAKAGGKRARDHRRIGVGIQFPLAGWSPLCPHGAAVPPDPL